MIDLIQYRSSIGLFCNSFVGSRCFGFSFKSSIRSEVCLFTIIVSLSFFMFSIFRCFSVFHSNCSLFFKVRSFFLSFSFVSSFSVSCLCHSCKCFLSLFSSVLSVRLLFFFFLLLSMFGCVESNPGPVKRCSNSDSSFNYVPNLKLRRVGGDDWEVVKEPLVIRFVKEGASYNIAGRQPKVRVIIHIYIVRINAYVYWISGVRFQF